MDVNEIKASIKELTAEDRRKVALYILSLEKEHLQGTIGPQLAEDLEAVTRLVHDAVERIKKHL